MTARSFDLAVVGGGLVGAAVAWGAARTGARVVVLDEGDIAFRASRGNFALVWVQSKGMGMPEYAAWTVASSEAWAGFADELGRESGIDVAHRRPGGFHLALSDAELQARADNLKRLHNQPAMQRYPYEILDRERVRGMLPEIGPEVVGGSFCPLDGHTNSLKLLRALHTALARAGTPYLARHAVETILPRGGGGFRLLSSGGTIEAARVALCAGNGNARLAPMLGLSVPVRPQRGQIVVTERVQPFLHHPVVTVRQTDEGSVMLGDSLEETGFDTATELGVTGTIANRAVRLFPRLARVNVVRTWAALRVMTPDGFPIYEELTSHPGAFVATCHSGVTLAANHARLVGPTIAAGRLPAETFAPFSARRFDVPQAA